MKISLGNLEKNLLQYFEKEDLLASNLTKLKTKLLSEFPEKFEKATILSCDNLAKLTEDNPQLIIDTLRLSILDTSSLTTIWSKKGVLSKENKTPKEKMDFIASIFELAPLFTLPAVLFSGGKQPLKSLKESKAVLGKLKLIGIDNKNEPIRKIRNANQHRFVFEKTWLLDEDKEKVVQIKDIDKIYNELNLAISWLSRLLLYSIQYIPKFGMSFFSVAYFEVMDNKQKYADYYEGFSAFIYPKVEEIETIVEPKPTTFLYQIIDDIKRKITAAFTIKLNLQLELSKNKSENLNLYLSNLNKIQQRISYHVPLVKDGLLKFRDSLKEADDKNKIDRTVDVLGKQSTRLIDYLEQEKFNAKRKDVEEKAKKKQDREDLIFAGLTFLGFIVVLVLLAKAKRNSYFVKI